jgi:hypothetical protein
MKNEKWTRGSEQCAFPTDCFSPCLRASAFQIRYCNELLASSSAELAMRVLPRALSCGLVWIAAWPLLAAGPASELAAAVDDLARNVEPRDWRTTRYVSFYHVAEKERAAQRAVLAYVLNSVSRAATLIPQRIAEGESTALVRIDLEDYKLPEETWEALVADREPYWHLTTEVLDPATRKKTTVYTDGGWVGLEAARRLREMTGSGGAIVRGDWLIAKATTPPHYYRLAGIGATLAEWQKLVGVDAKTIVALRANRGANLIYSGVTRQPRRISRWQGPVGGAWQTYDTFGDDPAKDPIRNPTFSGGYDASEHIAAKANGLHLFALFDAKGARQDTVPDRLAKDDTDPHGDGVLVPMLSCVRCHVEDGLRPFADDQRRLHEGGAKLLAADKDTAEILSAFYDSAKLEKLAARDREDYAEAVAQATGGLTVKQLVAALADVYGGYQNALVDPARARRELGIDDLRSLAASRDPVLLALVAGMSVQRKQWEASFAEAALLAVPR